MYTYTHTYAYTSMTTITTTTTHGSLYHMRKFINSYVYVRGHVGVGATRISYDTSQPGTAIITCRHVTGVNNLLARRDFSPTLCALPNGTLTNGCCSHVSLCGSVKLLRGTKVPMFAHWGTGMKRVTHRHETGGMKWATFVNQMHYTSRVRLRIR